MLMFFNKYIHPTVHTDWIHLPATLFVHKYIHPTVHTDWIHLPATLFVHKAIRWPFVIGSTISVHSTHNMIHVSLYRLKWGLWHSLQISYSLPHKCFTLLDFRFHRLPLDWLKNLLLITNISKNYYFKCLWAITYSPIYIWHRLATSVLPNQATSVKHKGKLHTDWGSIWHVTHLCYWIVHEWPMGEPRRHSLLYQLVK